MKRDLSKPLAPTIFPAPSSPTKGQHEAVGKMYKSGGLGPGVISKKIIAVDDNPRLNRKVERGYAKVEKKIDRAKGNPEKLKKIEKKYGYDYDAANKAGLGPDSTGHWPSIDPTSGRILKGPKHPSMIKTRRVEKILGNKVVKKQGGLYSVPKPR